MRSLTPHTSVSPPSLADAFEPERKSLQNLLSQTDADVTTIVIEARRALDRTGQRFTNTVSDVSLQKTGLWLIEIVKSSTSILDQGASADIVWHEAASPPSRFQLRQSLFYTAAAAFFFYALIDGSRLGMTAIGGLTVLHILASENIREFLYRLPFVKRPPILEDLTGNMLKAEARIHTQADSFIEIIVNALHTADHILLRLSEPAAETRWRDDPRLMGFVQSLLEAAYADDGDFALQLVGKDLKSILHAEGVKLVDYTSKTAEMFDVLPGLDQDELKIAAPALVVDGTVIKRGTIWSPDDDI